MRLLSSAATVFAFCAAMHSMPALAANVLLEKDFWKTGNLAAVKAAVAAGANPTEQTSDGYSPMWRALEAGTTPDVVQYFFDQGVSVNQPGYDHTTPVLMAARFNGLDVLKLIIDKGGDLNHQDDSWRDALGYAAGFQTDIAVFKLLMGKGLDPTALDISGRNSALTGAFLNPSLPAIEFLASVADIHAHDGVGSNALMVAAFRNPKAEIVKAMWEISKDRFHKNNDGQDALMMAAIRNPNTEIHKFLLEKGFDVKARDPAGRTPLSIAASANTAAVIDVLLAAGADINAADKKGLTPLHHAVQTNRPAVVSHLLAKGAKRDAADAEGKTPLAHAQAAKRKDAADVAALLQAN